MPLPPETTSYDTPGLLASMAFDGEMTARGGMSALFNPTRLSPLERDTIAERVKKAAGGGALTGAITDILLNPWVWAMFVFSPAGEGALAKGAAGLLKVAPEYSAFVRSQPTVLQSLGLSTPLTAMEGTPAQAIHFQAAGAVHEAASRPATQDLFRALQGVLKKEGLATLHLDDPALRGEALGRAQEISDAMAVNLGGLDREKVLGVATIKDQALKVAKQTVPALVGGDSEADIARLGLTDLRDSIRGFFKDRLNLLYGVEGSGGFTPDPGKIARVWRGMNGSLFSGKNAPEGFGNGVIRQLMGDEFVDLVRQGKVSQEQFGELVGQAFKTGVDENSYLPRNVSQVVGLGGAPVSQEALMQRRYRIFATTSAAARTKVHGDYLPDDLQRIGERWGLTEEGRKLLEEGRKALQGAVSGEAEPTRFLRLDAVSSADRYARDTGRSYAWFVQRPGPAVTALQRETYPVAGPVQGELAKGVPWATVMEGDAPAEVGGGWSLADAAEATHVMMTNPYAKRAWSNYLVPASTGQVGVGHSASLAAVQTGQSGLRAMLDGMLGKVLQRSGKVGQGVFDALERRADPALLDEQAQALSRGVAGYLYSTHLGGNLASAAVNSMQPWLLASGWLGAGNVAAAYPRAIKQILGYAQERAGMGVGPISDATKDLLFKKHFRLAGAITGGEDVLGINPNPFRALDDIGPTGHRAYETARGFQAVAEYAMKPFQYAEMLNKLVAGEAAVGALARARGVKGELSDEVVQGLFAQDPLARTMVKRIGLETQFGASPGNTILAMASKDPVLNPYAGFLTNPLARQFLNFPIRSLTGAVSTGPRLAGGVRRVLGREVEAGQVGTAAMDFARSMGISAVIYETGKAGGLDLSRGLFASSVSDLAGQRFSSTGRDVSPIPAPPVVQIPFDLLRGISQGDADLISYTLPRLVPGGVAIARAMGVMPKVPEPTVAGVRIGPQRTYADWKNPLPTGEVPLFKEDGTLIDYRHPAELVARALGLDFGKFSQPGQWDNFVLKNQEEIQGYKKRATNALLQGDMAGAEAIKQEFQKRWGAPLMLSRQGLKAAQRTAGVPRTQRIVSRLPVEVRPQYEAPPLQQPEPAGLGGGGAEEPAGWQGFGSFSGF